MDLQDVISHYLPFAAPEARAGPDQWGIRWRGHLRRPDRQVARRGGDRRLQHQKCDLVRSLGADHVVDHTRKDFTRNGWRCDVVFDLVGNRSLIELRRALTPTGTLVLSGGGVSNGGRLVGPFALALKAQVLARFVPHRLVTMTGEPPIKEHLAALRELVASVPTSTPTSGRRRYAEARTQRGTARSGSWSRGGVMSYDGQDVIVIGGGLAGLTAARELRNAGRRVLVLEARDRLGGRAFTSQFAGTEVELGGAFVHWFQPHIFAELTRYGIGLSVPPEPTRWSYITHGQVKHSTVEELAPRVSELFARCFADARATMPLPYQPLAVADAVAALDHLSVQDRLDQGDFTAEERDLLNPVLATSCSAPCSDGALTAMIRWFSLPGWDFALMLDAVGIYPLRTADLVKALAADARPEVRLSTPVAAIEQRDERVTVTARGGEAFTAPMVVVAVPLNTLGKIDFRPALASETQAVADRGQASRGVKLWAHVRGDLEPFFFMAPDNHPLTFVVTEKVLDDGSQLLVGFGPDAQRLHPDDDREVRRAFAERLPAGGEVVAVTGHDWWTDEFSRGTWSVFRPGQLTALPALQAPHGRVVFAGSDVAGGWNGFMDGAIESGLRAARSITQLLQTARASTVAS